MRARASETGSTALPEARILRSQQTRQELSDCKERATENIDTNERYTSRYTCEAKGTPKRNNASQKHGVRDQAERIVAVFYEARRDYFKSLQNEGFASMTAIRFLRDTAENALLYLRQNAMMDHSAVADLQENFAIARDKAAELCGGRKRHFDDNKDTRSSQKRTRRLVDSYRPSEY